MTQVILSSTPYTRVELRAYTKGSAEMHFNRDWWGNAKCIKVIDKETITFNDVAEININRKTPEAFLMREQTRRSVSRKTAETLELKDNGNRRGISVRSIEALQITDIPTLKIKRFARDRFSLIDEDERLPNTVIYDLELEDVPSNLEDFETYANQQTPLNYSPIRPLVPGEYEYQTGIVGIELEIPPTEGRFGIIGSTLHIDVEDTVDRGESFVPTGGVVIKFAKRFYNTPRVFPVLIEAESPAAIEVTEVTKESFKVQLKSLQNVGTYVNGSINWLADGF